MDAITQRELFRRKMLAATHDGLSLVEPYLNEEYTIERYSKWPQIRQSENGLPEISINPYAFYSNPFDYSSMLSDQRGNRLGDIWGRSSFCEL